MKISGRLAVISGLVFFGYCTGSIGYKEGIRDGLEQAKQRSEREKIIMTHTGYEHLADRSHDGRFDVLRRVKCKSGVSDTLYVRKGHGPAQSVDSVVKVVEDKFFTRYKTSSE